MVLAAVDRKTTVVRVCKWQCACETQPKNINYRHWQAKNIQPNIQISNQRISITDIGKQANTAQVH